MVTTIPYTIEEQSSIVNSPNINAINLKFICKAVTFPQATLLFIGMH